MTIGEGEPGRKNGHVPYDKEITAAATVIGAIKAMGDYLRVRGLSTTEAEKIIAGVTRAHFSDKGFDRSAQEEGYSPTQASKIEELAGETEIKIFEPTVR